MTKFKAFIAAFLIFSFPFQTLAAGIPFKYPGGDQMQFGKPESSDAKELEFNTGDSPNNVKMSVNDTTRAVTVNSPDSISLKSDTVNVGDGTAADQDINFDIGAGANNPKFGYNNGTSALEFCNDGVTCKKIGSGAGGGAGLNTLADFNADMEAGTQNWTASGGTLAEETTNVANGAKSLSWDPSATSQTMCSNAVTISANSFGVLPGDSCTSVIYYLWPSGGSGDIKFQAVSGASTVLSEVDLEPTPAATWRRTEVTYPCPASGTLKTCFESTTDAAVIKADDAFQGRYELIDVSQAVFVGSITFDDTCFWTITQATYAADFTGDASCGTTVSGDVSVISGVKPGVEILNAARGHYKFIWNSAFEKDSTSTSSCIYRMYDGTSNISGEPILNDSGETASGLSTIVGELTQNTAGNITVDIQARGSTAIACVLGQISPNTQKKIMVYRYPLESEQAVKPDAIAASWSGYHDTDCQFAVTNVGYIDFSTDATCTLGERNNVNFGTVAKESGDLPGITVNPSQTGLMEVCVNATSSSSTSGGARGFRLTDSAGTTIYATAEGFSNAQTGGDDSVYFCGHVPRNSIASQTVKLLGTSGSGAFPHTLNGGNTKTIEWRIKFIDKPTPAPLLVNSVVNPRAGVTKTLSATLNCDASSAITSQDGSVTEGVASIGNISSGVCAVTFAGMWSAAGRCNADIKGSTLDSAARMDVTGATTGNLYCTQPSDGSALTACDVDIDCKGPR